MKMYLVNLDLKKQQDYQPLFDELDKLNGIKVFDSVWSFKLPNKSTCRGLWRKIMPFIDYEDGIIVSEITSYAWRGVDKAPHVFD